MPNSTNKYATMIIRKIFHDQPRQQNGWRLAEPSSPGDASPMLLFIDGVQEGIDVLELLFFVDRIIDQPPRFHFAVA